MVTVHTFTIAVGALVLTCAALFAAAFWRKWSVPLLAAVLIGLGIRLAIVLLTYGHTPHDVAAYFQNAGRLVLDGQNPATELRRFQWNFLPLMPYLFALEVRTGLSWELGGKIVPVIGDLAIIVLLSRLAPARHARSIPLLYALCPLAFLVSADHGQVEPVALALGLGALLLARRGAPIRAGILGGLSIATKTWPVLLMIGVLRQTPWRRWWRVVVPGAVVLLGLLATVPLFLHDSVRAMVKVLTGYRSFVGIWGWTGLLHYFNVVGQGYAGPTIDGYQRIGTVVTAVALVTALVLFRRANAVVLSTAVLLSFLAVTAGFGLQYLLWPLPFVLLLRRPAGAVFTLLSSCYAAFFYLVATPYPSHAVLTSELTEWGSVLVIASAVLAIPWAQRRGEVSDKPLVDGADGQAHLSDSPARVPEPRVPGGEIGTGVTSTV